MKTFNVKSYHRECFKQPEKLAEIKAEFNLHGIIKVSGLFTEEEVQRPIFDLLSILKENVGVEFQDVDCDETFAKLIEQKSNIADIALRITKDLPSFQHLISSTVLYQTISLLLDEPQLISPFDWSLFRIDGAATKVSHFDWHQDYPYNVISEQAVTFWLPLTDIDETMGAIRFVPGSHNTIYPILAEAELQPNNPNRLLIKRSNELNAILEQQTDAGSVKRGECLLFNTKLLHASGINMSTKYRWIANGRYAPANDKALMAREYYMARTKYPHYFKTAHPELIEQKD